MHVLLIWTAWIVGILVWTFSVVRVTKIIGARHEENLCGMDDRYWPDCPVHCSVFIFGCVFGPLMYALVVVYQLADGTYAARRRNRKVVEMVLSMI